MGVRLAETELFPPDHVLRDLARRRVETKAAQPDRKRPDGTAAAISDEEIDRRYIGLVGERLVANALHVPMTLDVSHGGDARVNLVTKRGVPVDVITRTIPRNRALPDLLLNTQEPPVPEMALVLVVYDEDPWIVGWMWEHTVRERNDIVEFSRNHSYRYPPRSLSPLYDLMVTDPWTEPYRQQPLV